MHNALLAGDPQDQLVIAYNLVIDNKRIADESEYPSAKVLVTLLQQSCSICQLLPNLSMLLSGPSCLCVTVTAGLHHVTEGCGDGLLLLFSAVLNHACLKYSLHLLSPAVYTPDSPHVETCHHGYE